jgi:CspA family cold shock protein
VASTGTVREWNTEEGWGVIDSADTPGGCWAHCSSVSGMAGYLSLTAGQQVTLTFEQARQDGYDYRAVVVWPPGAEPGTPLPVPTREPPSSAYQSRLTIRMSDGTVITRSGDQTK